MRLAPFLLVGFLLFGAADQSLGQFVRPPIIVPRPSVPVHVPHVHVPHGSNRGGGWDSDMTLRASIGVTALLGVGGGYYMYRKWRVRRAPHGLVRIIAVPPGEAPLPVRQAWVGLELPLIPGQVAADKDLAQQVVSRVNVMPRDFYAVDARGALAILEAASPGAAAWWRENTPDIFAAGYQLVFPAEVCERLDDLAPASKQ